MWWKKYNKEECPLKDTCQYLGKGGCVETCRWYYKSILMYDSSNLPEISKDIGKLIPEQEDLETFRACKKYMENVYEHVKKGEGIYLYSTNKGNGKTTWAFKFVHEYIKQSAMNKSIIDDSVYYINISELFEFLRINMNNKDIVTEVENRILGSNLVIFDDLGVESPTDWVTGKLYNYINYRYSQHKAMIITSNLSYPELSKRLGIRIMDRISEICRPLEFKGVSRRSLKGWWQE